MELQEAHESKNALKGNILHRKSGGNQISSFSFLGKCQFGEHDEKGVE